MFTGLFLNLELTHIFCGSYFSLKSLLLEDLDIILDKASYWLEVKGIANIHSCTHTHMQYLEHILRKMAERSDVLKISMKEEMKKVDLMTQGNYMSR